MGDNKNPTYPGAGTVDLPAESRHVEELLFPTHQKAGTYNPSGRYTEAKLVPLGKGGGGISDTWGKLDPLNPIKLFGGKKRTHWGWTTPEAIPDDSKPNLNPAYTQYAEYAKQLLNPHLFRRDY